MTSSIRGLILVLKFWKRLKVKKNKVTFFYTKRKLGTRFDITRLWSWTFKKK